MTRNATTLRVWTIAVVGVALLLLVWALVGCNEEPPASINDQIVPAPDATPIVTGVTPPPPGLAGATVLTIAGSNFSPVKDSNIVMFNNVKGAVLSASPTQLTVTAGVIVSDTVWIKVGRLKSTQFSTPSLQYKLLPAVEAFGGLGKFDSPVGMVAETTGVLYASMLSGTSGAGVKKFTADGKKTDYSPVLTTTVNRWTGMKMGWGGALFTASIRQIVWRIPPGGGAAVSWVSLTPATTKIFDLDFDANGNMWAAGDNATVFRLKQDKSIKTVPFKANVRAVRVYNNYLYLGGKRDSLEKVWRLPLVADTLGAEEEYFNFSSVYGANGPGVYSLTFSTDGYMYIGTNGADGIVLVRPDRTSEPLYPGLFAPTTVSLAWGQGAYLYVGKSKSTIDSTSNIFRVNTLKEGAPYYGNYLP